MRIVPDRRARGIGAEAINAGPPFWSSGRRVASPMPHAAGPPPLRALLVLLGVQVCFALFPALGRIALAGFEPEGLAAWRSLAGTAVFLVLARRRRTGDRSGPPASLGRLLLLSVLGVTLNQLLFIHALARSTAVRGGLMVALIPPLTCLAAIGLGAERPRPLRLLGVAVATLGTGQAVLHPAAPGEGGIHAADLLFLGNASVYAVYLVLARPVLKAGSAARVMAWVFGLSVPILVPAGASAMLPAAGASAWAALAGILLFPTVLAYLGNAVALRAVPASVAGLFVALQPVISVSVAAGLLGERISRVEVLMGVLVILGVILVSLPGKGAKSARS
jgi:drug/metabolite transporter (DMT)-like permease